MTEAGRKAFCRISTPCRAGRDRVTGPIERARRTDRPHPPLRRPSTISATTATTPWPRAAVSKAGRLFRSAHQSRISDADLAAGRNLGIGTIVDLRRPIERRDQPSKRRYAGFNGRVIENDLDAVGEAPHITFLKSADLTPDSGRRFMTALYGTLPFAPSHLDLFARYFRVLAESDGRC
jgi:hypothetical protein